MTAPLTGREAAVRRRLAAAVGEAEVDAAWAAYYDARTAGLCHEGAWEVALGRARRSASRAEPTSPPR